MKFKNETKEDVMFPVIYSDNLPSDKLIIKDGETKEVPDCAVENAKLYGLTPVHKIYGKSPMESIVEAEESSIGEVKVETKKKKVKKSKKAKKVE